MIPKMRLSGTRFTISTSRTSDDGFSTATPSESKKIQRRNSNSPKVMFQEPSLSNFDPKHKSGAQLLETHSTANELEETISVSASADDIDTTTEAESYDTFKYLETRTKKHLASQAELSRPPSGPLKGDDQMSFRDRGNTRRSTGFFGYAIEGILTQYPASRAKTLPYDLESTLRTETSAATTGTRMRFSENIGVQSLLFDPPETVCLPPLEATAFAVILQEALDSLDILKHIIPAPVDERWDDSYKTIDEKYGRPEEPDILCREEMGLLPLIPSVPQKLQRDRTYIYNILKGTNKDIKCLRRYDRLEVEVDDIVRILEGEHNLEINHEIWMAQVKQLRELIESNRLENEKEAKDLLASTKHMNAEIDNAMFLNNSKLGYVQRWEAARLEQQQMRLEIKEQELNDALGDCQSMERADQIVSEEVRTFLEANTKDLEDETIIWTTRCNEEVQRLEQQIDEMKERIEFQKLELQNLHELREERQAFLDECYAEKERISNEAQYWKAVNDAATVIQTQWRGYIVRHQLGQYKNLWVTLKKRNRRAAAIRKKNAEWEKKKAAEWGATDLKKLKNIVDPNA